MIRQLRERLDQAQKDSKEQSKLLQEREACIEDLERLRGELKLLQAQRHLQPEEVSQKELERLEGQVQEMRKKQLDLDHRLDDLEEDFDTLSRRLKSELAEAIMEAHPDKKGQYTDIMMKMSGKEREKKTLESVSSRGKKVAENLKEVQAIRKAARKRGFFVWLFGRSPTTLISNQLAAAVIHGDQLQPHLHEALEHRFTHAHVPETLKHLETLLESIQEEAKKQWSLKHIDETMKVLSGGFSTVLSQLSDTEEALGNEIIHLQEERDSWLKQNSTRD